MVKVMRSLEKDRNLFLELFQDRMYRLCAGSLLELVFNSIVD